MENIIAFCGLACDGCPIYLATQEPDISEQKKLWIDVARQCTEIYGMTLYPEDITGCDGCRSNYGRLFSGCLNCLIRKCAIEKGIENCAYCNDYACNILREFFKHDADAKTRLEKIRKTLKY